MATTYAQTVEIERSSDDVSDYLSNELAERRAVKRMETVSARQGGPGRHVSLWLRSPEARS